MAAKKKKTTSSAKTAIAPKKATPRKAPSKAKVISEVAEQVSVTIPVEASFDVSPKPERKIKKIPLLMLVLVVIIIILLYVFRNQFVVATVNGQPISRMSFNAEMQKEAGKKSVNALVTKTLILQEANKEQITVSDTEISNRIKQIENNLKQQGQTMNQFLAVQGITLSELSDELKLEISVEKMLGKKIQVSDKEVNDYIQKTQAANTTNDTGATPPPALSKTQVRQQLQQQKLSEQVQPWLANLQQQAKITYFITL
jgi:hypothetical protein